MQSQAASAAGDRRPQNAATCVLCGTDLPDPFLHIKDIPVHVGVLWPDAASAKASPTGDFALVLCPGCGLVTNQAFDPGLIDYTQKYDNSLHASPLFQEFEQALVRRLIDRYGIRGKTVAEIGCGSGHFLGLICVAGDNRGIGFDPSHDPDNADPLAEGRVEFIRDYYSDLYSDRHADLLCCRHTLEHVVDPGELLVPVRQGLESSRDTVVYFEVPNSTMAFRDLSVWDLIYEHCTYFVGPTLRRAFEAHQFEVLDLWEGFERQFISIEARPADEIVPSGPTQDELAQLTDDVSRFAAHFDERRSLWRQRFEDYRKSEARVVVWGAGARAVSFFNMLGVTEEIGYVVDMNPRKQGTFLGGTGQEIVSPEFLSEYRPDIVILVNPVYFDEISQMLADLGCEATVVVA
jgi:SAM-dependent methyltransferase